MKLKTLSASSADCYEKCPKRWEVTYTGDRVQELGSQAADIGTACHEALEMGVTHHILQGLDLPLADLLAYFDTAYWKVFTDRVRYDDGLKMLKNWHARMDFSGRQVVSTEVKSSFDLPTSAGPLQVNYIWDRCDRVELPCDKCGGSGHVDIHDDCIDCEGSGRAGYEIVIVDYKSYSQPVQPGELKDRIQPRLYALAAQIQFKDAARIRVIYDLLRYDQVGVVFTRDDNVKTWTYLKKLAERIIADNEPRERLNPDCRWCIRRVECDALRHHRAVGGPLSLDDPAKAVDLRRELVDLKAGVASVLDIVDDFLLDWSRENNTLAFNTDETSMEIVVSGKRGVDAERAATVIGPDIVAKHGSITMAEVDKLLKGSELDDEQKTALRGLITRTVGNPNVKTKERPAHERTP